MAIWWCHLSVLRLHEKCLMGMHNHFPMLRPWSLPSDAVGQLRDVALISPFIQICTPLQPFIKKKLVCDYWCVCLCGSSSHVDKGWFLNTAVRQKREMCSPASFGESVWCLWVSRWGTSAEHCKWTPGTESDVMSMVTQRRRKTVPISEHRRRNKIDLKDSTPPCLCYPTLIFASAFSLQQIFKRCPVFLFKLQCLHIRWSHLYGTLFHCLDCLLLVVF